MISKTGNTFPARDIFLVREEHVTNILVSHAVVVVVVLSI